jgi:hypothetical protein
MDHVVYLDKKANEAEKLLDGSKTQIIRGAAGRKLPYGRVLAGDRLYFINNDGSGTVFVRALVSSVINSEKLDPQQSAALIAENQPYLQLSESQIKRWSGKRFLVLVTIKDFEPLLPFMIDRREYGNMDDWLPVEDIEIVKIPD